MNVRGALVLSAVLTIVFITLGVLIGIGACASVQGLNVCLDYLSRTLSVF